MKLAEHSGSEKSVVFTTRDFSDESSGKQELFCMRFGSVDKVKAFWAAWEGAQAANEKLGVGAEGAAAREAAEPASPASVASDKTVLKSGRPGAEEEGEEVSSKAGEDLAGLLEAAKLAPPK